MCRWVGRKGEVVMWVCRIKVVTSSNWFSQCMNNASCTSDMTGTTSSIPRHRVLYCHLPTPGNSTLALPLNQHNRSS